MVRCMGLLALLLISPGLFAQDALRKAVTLYASFDHSLTADFALGQGTFATRFNHEKEMGKFVFEKGFNNTAFRVAAGKGVHGGAMEAVDVLPRNGRIFYPAKGHLAFKEGGWSGALSVWVNTDPNRLLKTKFCDPIQITQKGANNGGIWFDFNDAKPRDLRMGVFPAVKAGEKAISEEAADAPMVRVPKIDWVQGKWHHVVLNWKQLDTGKADAVCALHIDGKLVGEVKDRPLAMGWDIEHAGIYVAVNYIGRLDELAVFNRALTSDEIRACFETPGLFAGLKN